MKGIVMRHPGDHNEIVKLGAEQFSTRKLTNPLARVRPRLAPLLSSARADWGTPPEFFAKLDTIFHFDLDVCADGDNHKCARYYTIEENGLAQPWYGTNFMNPPYVRRIIDKWLAKAYRESVEHGATVVCLVPSRTGSAWYRNAIAAARSRTDLPGRLKFVSPDEPGKRISAPFDSSIIIFGPEPLSDSALRQLDALGHTERLDVTRELVQARGQATTQMDIRWKHKFEIGEQCV